MRKQSRKQTERIEMVKTVGTGIGCLFLIYFMIATAVFQYRHPYITETEQFIHTWDALQFKKFTYQELRERK